MAITKTNFTLVREQGLSSATPTAVQSFSFEGDGAYLAGGSEGFAGFAAEALNRHATDVTSAEGWGLTAGAITHMAIYDRPNDKLQVFVLATGVEAGNGDLSAITFGLTLICR